MTPLRLLLLDDNPDDRVLALRELRREFEVSVVEVGERNDFEAALDEASFDVVITDYQMRWTTGMEVLERVKIRWPGIPVIMFTATGTQDIAVQAMKAGLDDYVVKSPRHYVRLCVAVRSCLDRHEVRLRAVRSEMRLQSLLEHSRMGVFRMSLEGGLLDANRALRAMLDLPTDAALGDIDHPLLAAARQSAGSLAAADDTTECDVAGDGGTPSERRYWTMKLVRVRVNGHDAIDALVEDMTSLRRADEALHALNRELEQRVQLRTQQLEQANSSLEAFAYSVSHDLREPVRTLQGYARAVREDVANGRMDDVLLFLDRMEHVAHHADGMVSDLLAYATLARTELKLAPVSLAAAVDEASAYLAFDPVFQRAQVLREAAPWPQVMAHQGTLVQVLVNLLSNASKFVAPDVVPQITLRAGWVGQHVRLEVEDNGIGVAERDHERIFKVFERLHGPESYAGTGIGLALVHKGMERMGGEVGLQSQVGQGSCFWIVLPAAGAQA